MRNGTETYLHTQPIGCTTWIDKNDGFESKGSKGFESKGIKGNQRDSLKEIFLSRRGDEEVNDYVDVHSWFPRLPSRFVLNLFAAELEDELN